jgi:hypothetical protein
LSIQRVAMARKYRYRSRNSGEALCIDKTIG